MKKVLIFFIHIAVLILLTMAPVFAQNVSEDTCTGAGLAERINCSLGKAIQAAGIPQSAVDTPISAIVVNIVNVSLTIIGLIFILMILYGGYLWMTAAGNQDRIDRAKSTLRPAIIGITIVISSLVITRFVIKVVLESTGAITTL